MVCKHRKKIIFYETKLFQLEQVDTRTYSKCKKNKISSTARGH